ncbi:hypothetical protein [Pseudopedobacter beijingensis]|uniref:DUF5723 domain-containing protein n=1 Tax=Pseudopedobacter beijingensis TaxID=1207056 RepID=A0ABW4IBB4_9SPHI
MYRKLFLSVLFTTVSLFSGLFAQEKKSNLHVGVMYPVSSNGKEAPAYSNEVSLHLLGGLSNEEEAVSFAGIFNKVNHNVKGVHIAGIGYHVGQKADGVLFSGVLNNYKSGKGVQLAGIANLAKEDVKGFQFGGIFNKAKRADGFQFAGIMNMTDSATLKGGQFSGIFNSANSVRGVQISGIANQVKDSVSGVQFAGIGNIAQNVKGSQFSGIFNKAKKVSGIQFAGILNIADSSDYPIAIINVIKNGEKSIGLSIDDQSNAIAAFRSGGKVLYGILGLGYNLKNKDEVYALQAGFGAHLWRMQQFQLNTELTHLTLTSFKKGDFYRNSLAVMPTYRIGNKIDVFLGGSVNYMSTGTEEGKGLTKNFLHSWNGKNSGNFQGLFLGYSAGLKLIL